MKKNVLNALAIIGLALLFASAPGHGQTLEEFCGDSGSFSLEDLQSLHILDDEGTISSIEQFCELALGIRNREPDVINKAIRPWLSPDSGLAFLKDVDFKIKAFENDSDTSENGLGFSYDYTKVIPLNEYRYSGSKNTTTGYSANFKANGNVAFDDDINPADFLDTRLSFSGFRYRSGISQNGATDLAARFDRLNKLEDDAAGANSLEEQREILERTENIVDEIRNSLGSRSYIEVDLNVGIESDQKFDQTQWSYGAQVALDYKSHKRDAWQTQFNMFDWPFALIRMFSGHNPNDSRFQPYGSTIPTLVFGYDQVDPQDNLAREAVGETSSFDRYRAEIFFRTPIAYIGNSEIWFNADWRFYQENSASAAIKAADLDKFDYRTISISSSNGVFVSYRKGSLPFDIADERAYEIGWKFNFGQF